MEPLTDAIYELNTRQSAERYGCENYSTFHNRMVKLGIKPERRGRHSFLNQNQIQLLDRLDIHLKQGGTFSNFIVEEGEPQLIPANTKSTEIEKIKTSSPAVVGNNELVTALQALATSNYDILTPQKKLLEAVEYNFLLTTEQVSQILNFSKSTVSSWKNGTQKLGFVFTRTKEGSQVLWEVKRAIKH